jgi:predicted nucleotidyltransferase component of viral defense system
MSLVYNGIFSQTAKLEVDLNYVARVPLWPTIQLDSCKIGTYQANSIPTLDLHELFAGKLTALFARRAGRDLFDAYQLFKIGKDLDNDRFYCLCCK